MNQAFAGLNASSWPDSARLLLTGSGILPAAQPLPFHRAHPVWSYSRDVSG